MRSVHISQWNSINRRSSTLFFAAGVLFVGHAVVRGIEAFTTMPPPVDLFGPTGWVAAILGLFSLYPTIADSNPRVARVAGVTGIVTAAAWVLISGWNFGEAAGLLPPQTEILPGAFFAAVIISTLLIYFLFAGASLRTDVHSRTFGLLLVAPAVLFMILLVGGGLLSLNSAVGGVIIGLGQAIAHGAIGGVLLSDNTQTDQVAQPSDMAAD